MNLIGWVQNNLLLTSVVLWSEEEALRKSDEDRKKTIIAFLIKKRINTELFIERKWELYIQKKRKDRIKKISDLFEEGRILAGNK